MAELLAVADVRSVVQTDLADAALQLYLDNAAAEIEQRCGPLNSITETLVGDAPWIFPQRPLASVQKVLERLDDSLRETELNSKDYSIHHGGWAILRETSGPNPRRIWGTLVTVTGRPPGGESEMARRRHAQLELVKISLNFEALKHQKSGNWSGTYLDSDRERSRILRRLRTGTRRQFA